MSEYIEKKAVTDTSDSHLLDMLLEAINYVYKQLDGKYGNLSYVVSDKVKYIERVRAEKIEQKKREEYEAAESEPKNWPADKDNIAGKRSGGSELGNGPWEKNYQPSGINQPVCEEADKAAEEACAKCPISGRCFAEDKGRKDACGYLRGVKAGIAYERERMMKEAVEAEVYWNRGNEPRVIVHLPKGSAMPGDKVKLIILK